MPPLIMEAAIRRSGEPVLKRVIGKLFSGNSAAGFVLWPKRDAAWKPKRRGDEAEFLIAQVPVP